MSGKAKSWFAVAVLACAACCAVPIMAVLGIGGAAGAMTAAFSGWDMETIACVGILGALVGALVYFSLQQLKRRKQEAAPCETSCRTDASCCGPQPKK